MGAAHARAYHALAGFEIAGLVARRPGGRERLASELGGCPLFSDFESAFVATRPDAVCIATYPDTHAGLAIASMRGGAGVFVEKPLADTLESAESVVSVARETGQPLLVGYILRCHPGWIRFIELARALGRPLVMRISQTQQSSGEHWRTQQRLLSTVSPLVDCGVHYVDVMCQMTQARPMTVQGIGARLSDGLPAGRLNYAQLQLRFEDGSIGWYEAGWGPMLSEEAAFVRDVVGPDGSVTMTDRAFVRHQAALDGDGRFAASDETEPAQRVSTLADLCRLEQELFLRALTERLDLSAHHAEALLSLRIVLAAERSIGERRIVDL